ncbi:MAG: DUF1778 domain-containing protein [Hyphomicrobiaceae bacterium]
MSKKVIGSRLGPTLGRTSASGKFLTVSLSGSRRGESFAIKQNSRSGGDLEGQRDVGRKSSKINLRIDPETQNIIDRAASALGKTRSEFMLESARERAEDVLLDRRVFTVNDADWHALADVLDNPPPPNDALKALLSKAAPWEK